MTASTRKTRTSVKPNTPEPLPADPTGQRLCSIFGHCRWNFIQAERPDNALAQVDWQTVSQYPLRPRVLWGLWQEANTLLGVRFTNETTYALLDIDIGSDYHGPESVAQLRAAIETIGLARSILLRSSWNGGLHLYIPLPEPVNTFSLAVALKECLRAQNFRLQPGHLEIFPNVKAYGMNAFTEYNAHRLPLQPASGSCLLDDDLNPVGHRLDQFFWLWDQAASYQDMEALKEACLIARDNHRKKPQRRHNPVDAWRQDLETEIAEGWTSYGQTNHLLKSIACYGRVFERLHGQRLIDYVIRVAIECPGYQQYCRHQQEIRRRAQAWARSAENYYWPLGTTPIVSEASQNNLARFNRQQAESAQHRIRDAYVQLDESGELPEQITARVKAIAQIASVSQQTLYKNLALWHPAHQGVINEKSRVSAPESEPDVVDPGSLKPLEDKVLHPLKKNMKGEAPGDPDLGSDPKDFEPPRGVRGDEMDFPQPQASVLPIPLEELWLILQQRVRRVGLTAKQIQQFIAMRFNGCRRAQLKDEDLLLLLYYLSVELVGADSNST